MTEIENSRKRNPENTRESGKKKVAIVCHFYGSAKSFLGYN